MTGFNQTLATEIELVKKATGSISNLKIHKL